MQSGPALTDRLLLALEEVDRRQQRRTLVPVCRGSDGTKAPGIERPVDFASNDYLDLSSHELLAERSNSWARMFGSGSRASRLVSGTLDCHVELERRLAKFKGREAALLFPSGWHLNSAVLSALLKAAPGALLFSDKLIHASLHAGASAVRQIRFRHNDLDHLEELLAKNSETPAPKLIVTESVFSMDGDCVDLARICEISKANGAFLYVDEAHATGVLGPQGRGLSYGLPHPPDLVMGTCGKALGCFGAFVASSKLVIDYLINCCPGFVFSTAPPPSMLGAIDAALDLVPEMDLERQRLSALGARLRSRLERAGIDTLASSTQIVPIVLGDAARALIVSQALRDRGFLVAGIRPPTVPKGSSRLRVALRAGHSLEIVDKLAAAIIETSGQGGA